MMLIFQMAAAIVVAFLVILALPLIIITIGYIALFAILLIVALFFLYNLKSVSPDVLYIALATGIITIFVLQLCKILKERTARINAELRYKEDSKNQALSMLGYFIKRQKLQWNENNHNQIDKLKEQLQKQFGIDEEQLRAQFNIVYD